MTRAEAVDRDVYLDDFGASGRSWRETDNASNTEQRKRGADVRPDFSWKGLPRKMMGFR